KVLELRGEYAMSGFIGGVSSMEPEVIKAMANAASAGTRAIDSVSAIPSNAGIIGGAASPVFNINYDFTGASVGSVPELETMLQRRDNNLKEYILEVMDDEARDKSRRAFI
ncbi:MAG: hypothetical protein PHT33_09230, partial [bacterium]|nr:hypothetical protein [bacterium]